MVFLRDSLVALIPRLTSSPHIVIETKSNHLKKSVKIQKIREIGIFKTEKFEIRTSNIEKLKTRKSQKIENVLKKKKKWIKQ